uniref:Transmembrane protein n=1 Tax=Salix viminalis TaxID=40686 RepID=A0A6N2KWF1_SALVM
MLCRKSQVLRQNRAANFEFQKNIFRKSSLSHSALSSFSALPLFLFLSLYGSSGSSPSSLHFVLWISQLLARKATRREKKTRRKKINSEAAPFFRRQV